MPRKFWKALASSCTGMFFDYQWLNDWFKVLRYNQDQFEKDLKHMSQALDDLKAQVAANVSLEASAIQLISRLADQIAAAANDPVALQQLTTDLKAEADKLAAALVAGTPASPTTTTEPPVGP